MTATDRIAQLTEELGEMRAARDRFDRLARSHEAAHERTKAELARVSDAGKREYEQGVERNDYALKVEAERDAAQAAASQLRAEMQPLVVETNELRREVAYLRRAKDAAQAELAEARSSRNEWERRALDRNKSIDDLDRQCDTVTRQRDITRSEEERLTAERDEANAERDAAIGDLVIAQADAAAMRAVLTSMLSTPHSATTVANGWHTDGFCRACADQYAAGIDALDGSAGRALADRVAPLEATITRVREIFPQLQGAIVHGEGGTVAKLMTALGVALGGGR